MIYLKHINEYFDTYKSDKYFKDSSDCKKFGSCLMSDWEKNLSEDEKCDLEWYRDGGFIDANTYLYIGEDKESLNEICNKTKLVSEYVKNIQKIINKAILTEDIVVYKGVAPKIYGKTNPYYNLVDKLGVGDVLENKGFLSSTIHYQYSVFGFGGIILRIKIKKGYNAAYISLANEFGDRVENEILLNSGIKFKVIDIKNIKERNQKYKLIELSII
jgi:hypothetical protein